MSVQFLNHFLSTVEDTEVMSIIEIAHSIASSHISYLSELFQQENLPVPNGFSESDVNLNAPRLYTDSFMLTYINHMSRAGMLAFSGLLSMSTRRDIRKFFKEELNKIADLYDEGSEVLLQKGLYVRPPYIDYPKQNDFVDSKSYLSGLNPFTTKRPLNAVEISHLNINIQNNVIGLILSA
jgi:hypothetical protein